MRDGHFPKLSTNDPWDDLNEAIYVRARLDLLYGGKRLQADAEAFFQDKGIDPEKVRAAWAGRKRSGRPRRK